jgi:adenylate cyclase class IV
MIEVEVRGKLTKPEYDKIKKFLTDNGEFLSHQEREMYLLYGYEGYSMDPITRQVDIRIRSTNGKCEIMLKRKLSDGNIGRSELSLKLEDNSLDKAKEVVKALGIHKGLKMQRIIDNFSYNGILWSLVQTPKDYFYFEGEIEVEAENEISPTHAKLEQGAKDLGLQVLDQNQTREFIEFLDKTVNEEVEL